MSERELILQTACLNLLLLRLCKTDPGTFQGNVGNQGSSQGAFLRLTDEVVCHFKEHCVLSQFWFLYVQRSNRVVTAADRVSYEIEVIL